MKTYTTKEAVLHILETETISKYRLAKILDVQPIMIFKYLQGTRMRQDTAHKVKTFFNLEVSDVYGKKD